MGSHRHIEKVHTVKPRGLFTDLQCEGSPTIPLAGVPPALTVAGAQEDVRDVLRAPRLVELSLTLMVVHDGDLASDAHIQVLSEPGLFSARWTSATSTSVSGRPVNK